MICLKKHIIYPLLVLLCYPPFSTEREESSVPMGVCDTRGALETWTLRDFGNRVLRVYEHPWNQGWQVPVIIHSMNEG